MNPVKFGFIYLIIKRLCKAYCFKASCIDLCPKNFVYKILQKHSIILYLSTCWCVGYPAQIHTNGHHGKGCCNNQRKTNTCGI